MVRWGVCVVALYGAAGCRPAFTELARNGITLYVPGAGNVDFGDAGLREGLAAAGYKGQVASLTWTLTFNPALDQAVRIHARLAASELARLIESYVDKFPGRRINLVGLSAGTGIVIWALEDLKRGYQVDEVVLLASSLSCDYDVSKALAKVKGTLHNYYSEQDMVLAGPMKVFGTIDLKYGVDGAGAVGLKRARSDRVVNVRWRPEFEKYGYYGGHTDATSPKFVQAFIARDLKVDGTTRDADVATAPATAPRDAPPGSHPRAPAPPAAMGMRG